MSPVVIFLHQKQKLQSDSESSADIIALQLVEVRTSSLPHSTKHLSKTWDNSCVFFYYTIFLMTLLQYFIYVQRSQNWTKRICLFQLQMWEKLVSG
jgi:RsiW-degrading membrane proteinase PrsW (M82 family)